MQNVLDFGNPEFTTKLLRDMARASGSRVLVIVGQQDAPREWAERFMGIDLAPMVSQVTKGCWEITSADEAQLSVNRALRDMSAPSPRPVVLSMTTAVQKARISYRAMPPDGRRMALDILPSDSALQATAQMIAAAESPVIFASRAVADVDAVAELVAFAETIGAPVYTGNEDKVIFPSGKKARFLHLNSVNKAVKPGRTLQAGTPLGTVGSTGRSGGPHLHYEILSPGGKILNPLDIHGTKPFFISPAHKKSFQAQVKSYQRKLKNQ